MDFRTYVMLWWAGARRRAGGRAQRQLTCRQSSQQRAADCALKFSPQVRPALLPSRQAGASASAQPKSPAQGGGRL
jgi:hypothetical protein